MKNKIFITIVILFFGHSFVMGQQKIDKVTFEKLVNYANSKYVQAFIEKNDAGKAYFEDIYKKKVKPELERATLSKLETILDYDDLENLLSNNLPALQLAKKINDRKLKYEEFQDNVSLINSLVTTGWRNIDLSKVAENIQNDILTTYISSNEKKGRKISESDIVKTQTIQTSRQVEELNFKLDQFQQQVENLKDDTKIIDYQESFENFRFIVFSLLGLFFFAIIVIVLFLYKVKSRDYIINQVLGSERIANKFTQKDNTQLSNTSKPYLLTEKDINTIADRVLECKLLDATEYQQQNYNTSITKQLINGPIYLKGKSGKLFNRLENTPENSFFKLISESYDTALFEFCGDEAEAIAKRIFSEEICHIISGNYQNAKSVRTNRPGKIKRAGDQWEVIELIEIKLI